MGCPEVGGNDKVKGFPNGCSMHSVPVKTQELESMGSRRERIGKKREEWGGEEDAHLCRHLRQPTRRDPGKKKGIQKKQARSTVKNFLIESPMSKCNNKQKYTCINMYI